MATERRKQNYERKLRDGERQLRITQVVHRRVFQRFSRPLMEALRKDMLLLAGEKYHEQYHTEAETFCVHGCETKKIIDDVFNGDGT